MQPFIPEIIRRKRNGESLAPDEIRAVIAGYTEGTVPDYQMSALLMAIYFSKLNGDELSVWTDAMLHSGDVLVHAGVDAPKIDKHSTGGVGDKISIPLAPAVACCGVAVPMISGRGLGHTGGTLDKLESIPGFRTDLSVQRSGELLESLGMFLAGQTERLAPADRKLYALRDVTGTVESIPLIASSIMSKKLAEGIDGLVLDVKVGAGAFMENSESARALAQTMIQIGQKAGKRIRAVLTDMNSPIGMAVGNALEIRESLDVLRGQGPFDTVELTVELGAQMLVLGGAESDPGVAADRIRAVLSDGRALDRFRKVVEAQGGDPAAIDDPKKLPTATHQETITAPTDGYIAAIRPRPVAFAANSVGAGRQVKEDTIDPAAGVTLEVRVGDRVQAGQPLARLHHNRTDARAARSQLEDAFEISQTAGSPPARILERI